MNRWRRSVGEIQARKRKMSECEQAQAAFCKLTACFQQMSTCLGSNMDSSILRDELEEIRRLAHQICKELHQRVLALLIEMEQEHEDCKQIQRLWALLLYSLENFQFKLKKVTELQHLFPLTKQRAMVNTGATGGGTEVAGLAATVQNPWMTTKAEQKHDLKNHVLEIDLMLEEMLQKVNIPLWSVEPTQKAWAECMQREDDDLLEEMLEVEVVSQDGGSRCCSHSNCKLGCIFCMLH